MQKLRRSEIDILRAISVLCVIIFHFDKKGAVFTGAGNLTISAFKQNFENFYYITIPEVYDAFANQYNYLWFKLGKSHSELPTKLELP